MLIATVLEYTSKEQVLLFGYIFINDKYLIFFVIF